MAPFQVEMYRRIWWNVCVLDLRISDDEGSELAIRRDSHTTGLPLNLNHSDIWPDMEHPPVERPGLTEMTSFRLCSKFTLTTQGMMATGATDTAEDHDRTLTRIAQELEMECFSLTDQTHDAVHLATAAFMRMALCRLTISAFVPVVTSSPTLDLSATMRNKLVVTAIDVLEYNHALNSDESCQPWRWVYQTQQHWHVIVYLLIELSRSLWSSSIERAWVALQSPWLVPARAPDDKTFSVLIPLRKLMAKVRLHRDAELSRLRSDPDTAAALEREDVQRYSEPSSSITFPSYFASARYRERWYQLVHTVSALSTSMRTDQNISHDTAISYPGNGSPANVAHKYGHAPSRSNAKSPIPTAHVNGGVPTPTSAPSWSGESTALPDYSDLNAFLSADVDTDFGLVDGIHDDDLLDFDWNNWFDLAKGSL